MRFSLASAVTKAASFSATPLILGCLGRAALRRAKSLSVTLDVVSAERDSGNETYDFYITTGDGVSVWDVVHFPQVLSTGAKRYTALVDLEGIPREVTTASPGVEDEGPATMKTDTAAADQGIKTLAAGKVRHGALGDRLSYELVVAGTVVTGIVYSIRVEVN